MTMAQPIGYVDEIRAWRQSVMATAPASARRKIMGWPPVWRPEKTHRIEVDLRTGSRVITQDAPPPSIVIEPLRPVRRLWQPKEKPVTAPPPGDVIFVLNVVAGAFGIPAGAIQSRCRTLREVHARFAWVALLKADGRSYAGIGRAIRRDHTSIMHACARAADLMATSPDWRNRYEAAHIALDGGVC